MNILDVLSAVTNQINDYSSFLGQFWYILAFGFRLFVVSSVGGQVYGDEMGSFHCSIAMVGCTSMCFNAFARISHLRFWTFQLIGTVTPTVFFHLYTLHVKSQIAKIKEAEEALKADPDDTSDPETEKRRQEMKEQALRIRKKMTKRQNKLGKFKMRKVYNGSDSKEIPESRRVKIAFIASLVVRLSMEILFTYLGYKLFNIDKSNHVLPLSSFLWMRVPALFQCRRTGDVELDIACGQHFNEKNTGFVPCWVARPYEKTVFLRAMNILSFMCTCLTALEVLVFAYRQINRRLKKKALPEEKDDQSSQTGQNDRQDFIRPNYTTASRKLQRKLSEDMKKIDLGIFAGKLQPSLRRPTYASTSIAATPAYATIRLDDGDEWDDNSSQASSRRQR